MNKDKFSQNQQNYISSCYPSEMIDDAFPSRFVTNAARNTGNFSPNRNANACSLQGGCSGGFGGGNANNGGGFGGGFFNPMQGLFGNQNYGGQNFNGNQNFNNNQNFANNQNYNNQNYGGQNFNNNQNFQAMNDNFSNANNFQNPFGGGNMLQNLMQMFSQNMPNANIMSLLSGFMPGAGMGSASASKTANKSEKTSDADTSVPKIDSFKKIKNLD